MAQFAIMTQTGRNKEAAALAGGTTLSITEIAWGDGDRIPGGNETRLQNEQGRKTIQGSGTVADALNTAFFEILLDVEEGPFIIRESGLFDEDGDLIAIAHYDPPVNKPKDTVSALVRIHVVFSDLQNLVLQVQGTDAYVPVERQIIAGTGLTGSGDLAADRTLAVNFASLAQARAGLATDLVINPAALRALLDDMLNGAPGALDTFNELAEALGDDPNFAATILDELRKASPIGEVKIWTDDTAPYGSLEGDRATYLRADYPLLWAYIQTSAMYDPTGAIVYMFGPGDGATSFDMPETRGEFLRFWDHGRGVDAGRLLGSWQADEFRSHTHTYVRSNSNNASYDVTNEESGNKGTYNTNSGAAGGDETRPRSVAYMAVFRAY
ncbi:phage tail protein [Ruegeria sp. ANG-R]|uniref:phage tail-collar fiber domain-containing protein n=1 Tax=Ruegeria sp. ANG-R TaxID=1577903 RepID=UPI00068C0C15|nr:phage tail protein [Ruegeria sp. ANG-R]